MPARTQTLSGHHMFHAKNKPSNPEKNYYTFPAYMKKAGYKTMRTGKDENHPKRIYAEFEEYLEIKRHTTCSEEHTNNGINFIKKNAGKNPFFLYTAYATLHDPQQAPKEY